MGRASERGVSLAETLVALVLIAVVLLFTLALLGLVPKVERRLDAHRRALHLLETELEILRSEAAVPAEGELAGIPFGTVGAAAGAAGDVRLFAEVEVLPERSLRRVKLSARYTVEGRPFEQSLETMIFSP